MVLFDTHAHLCDEAFAVDLDSVVQRALEAEVERIVCVGETLRDARRNLELAKLYPNVVLPAAGLFPTILDLEQAEELEGFIREHQADLVAIGEVGLDYWQVQEDSSRELQREIFARFIELSKELELPLNVHSRSAGHHTIDFLLEHGARQVQLHAFDGKASRAERGFEAGFYFSVPPSIVRSVQKQKLVKRLPLSCLLLETDSPVLGPVPDVRNEPSNLVRSLEAIAEVKSLRAEAVAEAVAENTARLYGANIQKIRKIGSTTHSTNVLRMRRTILLIAVPALIGLIGPVGPIGPGAGHAASRSLRSELGRNEVRVLSAPHLIRVGERIGSAALASRLAMRGYERVRHKPTSAGEFFWGFERFWIHRKEVVVPGWVAEPVLLEVLTDRSTGRVEGIRQHGHEVKNLSELVVEPMVLAERLNGQQARRRWLDFEDLPEHVWRSVLAIEDARFFDHGGVDPRSVARALLKNATAGKVKQGGSTITQQLIKIRDLTPRRTLGRKVSEAARALTLEAFYSKRDILEAYLNAVYMGQLDGVALYGFGAAARAYFGKPGSRLTLAEAALFAGMIQGPNRLNPRRHPEAALERQQQVLSRLAELGWASESELSATRRVGLPKVRSGKPLLEILPSVLSTVRGRVEELAPLRAEAGRGVIVETTLDAYLQRQAEDAIALGLANLRSRYSRLRSAGLQAALVAIDGRDGSIVASVGGDPAAGGELDRVRRARRQPGSTVKPFVVLEALDRCGERRPLHVARRIADRPLTIALPSGPWRPSNANDRFREVVDLRTTLVESLNVPLVRVARWCGWQPTAARFRSLGLEMSEDPPPSFVLGALEVSPLELASAYTVFTDLGTRHAARLVRRISNPSGRGLGSDRGRSRRVSGAASAYLVRDLLREASERSLGLSRIEGQQLIGKTGTSSSQRDAWFAGTIGPLVAVVWVGFDEARSLGLNGSQAAAPIWRAFAERAAGSIPSHSITRPRRIVERWVDPRTGLRVRSPRNGAYRALFRDGDEPPRKSLFFGKGPEPVID